MGSIFFGIKTKPVNLWKNSSLEIISIESYLLNHNILWKADYIFNGLWKSWLKNKNINNVYLYSKKYF